MAVFSWGIAFPLLFLSLLLFIKWIKYNKYEIADENNNSSTNGDFKISLYDNITKILYLKSSSNDESFALGISILYVILFSGVLVSSLMFNWFILAILLLLLWVFCFTITFAFTTYTIKISSESSMFIKYLFGMKIKKFESSTNKMFGKVILTCSEYPNSSVSIDPFKKFGITISSKMSDISDITLICNQGDREKTKKARDLLAGIMKLPISFKRSAVTTENHDVWPEDNVEQLISEKLNNSTETLA